MDLALPRPDGLEDAAWASIESYRVRLENAIREKDQALILGTVKDLAEATAKVVLDARGQTIPSNEKFASVVQRAQRVLERQPGVGLAAGPPIRNVAQGASTIVIQLAEIRNQFGTGHGRALQPEVAEEFVHVGIDACLLWVRWALRRLSHLIAGQPSTLVRDLRDGGIFTRNALATRLRAANLPDLEPTEQHLLGVAVAQRAMTGTFMVMEDGVEACASSSDITLWPPDYRTGAVEGLFLDREGYVRTSEWGCHQAGLILAVHPQVVDVLHELSAKFDQAAWSFGFTADHEEREKVVNAMRAVVGILASEEAQSLWLVMAERFTTNPSSRLGLTLA
ncbi:abortive infection family protein [Nonomuraea sp. NPDC051941]|uniref:abortive infection family protein n=1 Tax=Nonomuraea sp. NPDC051941 TaxID=3364373 RepID=UPI0037CC1EA7